MSVLFALLLASTPTATPAPTVEKKPRLRCEWIHEVGTSRPRRVCEKRVEKAKPVEQPKTGRQRRFTDGKHLYGMSFCLYAAAAVYKATRDRKTLEDVVRVTLSVLD